MHEPILPVAMLAASTHNAYRREEVSMRLTESVRSGSPGSETPCTRGRYPVQNEACSKQAISNSSSHVTGPVCVCVCACACAEMPLLSNFMIHAFLTNNAFSQYTQQYTQQKQKILPFRHSLGTAQLGTCHTPTKSQISVL